MFAVIRPSMTDSGITQCLLYFCAAQAACLPLSPQ